MATPPKITIDDVRIAGIICPALALLATFTRLGERARTRKWGWDDTWATICLPALIMFTFALFVLFGDVPLRLQGPLGVAIFYMVSTYFIMALTVSGHVYELAQGFYAVIWCARLSIILSVIRITPPGRQQKLFSYASYAMGVFYCGLAIQTFVVCEQNPSWKNLPLPQCPLGKEVAIAQLATDILSDTMLIAAPVSLLWNVGITTVQRVRLIAIFSSTVATTAVSLVHAIYIIMFGGLPEIFTSIIEMAASLIVCNLSVLVPIALRLYRQGLRFKSSTTEENSQSVKISNTTGKWTRSTKLETIGNFSPRTGYTFGRVNVIAGPQQSQSSFPPNDPSETQGKEPLYPCNSNIDGCHDSSRPTFSTPFVYSSNEEEKAGRRGWTKGVKVAREVIANIPLDRDQYTHQIRAVVRHPQNATSRPTRADLEDYWGSGIKAIHKEEISSI